MFGLRWSLLELQLDCGQCHIKIQTAAGNLGHKGLLVPSSLSRKNLSLQFSTSTNAAQIMLVLDSRWWQVQGALFFNRRVRYGYIVPGHQ